jgi:HSP20 family protein
MGWLSRRGQRDRKGEVKVFAELPGLQEKDVDVELRDGLLTISGEKKSETEDKERRFSERYYGRFERPSRSMTSTRTRSSAPACNPPTQPRVRLI